MTDRTVDPTVTARAVPDGVIPRLAAHVRILRGWRRAGAGVLCGALAVSAMPPFNVAILLLPAFMGLVWLIEGSPTRRAAFGIGWWWGLGFFVPGLYWTTLSLFVDIARFWWLVPFALFGLPAGLAIFPGAATLVTHLAPGRTLAKTLVLALAWVAAEWLRGHILTGFPWILIGYAWSADAPPLLAVLQSTSIFGIYGLSLVTVAAAALPAALAMPGRHGTIPALAGLGMVVALGIFGWLRLPETPDPTVPGATLRIVQPNIAQTLKWDPKVRQENFQAMLALAATPGAAPVTDIILPEAAVTYLINRDGAARTALAAVTPPGGLMLAGSIRSNPAPDPPVDFYNSLAVIDGSGRILESFDKFHLVPFGEYVPLARYLPLDRLVGGVGALSSGTGPRTLDLPGLPPVSPLICYEAIFPGDVIEPGRRPGWLLAITNDAWFGISTGPYQHFAIARVRAVEQGMPLIRAANTGISGVVDPYGRVLARLGLDRAGIIDTPLPMAFGTITLYGRLGDAWLVILGGLVGSAAWALRRF
jgi:apolipoprotein N-acyltransferase